MQPNVLEVPCSSCHQNVPIERESCPYCSTPIKSYWFSDANQLKRAVPVVDHGKSYAYIDGKKLATDSSEFPSALRSFFPSSPGNDNLRKQPRRFSLSDFLGVPPPAKPSQWDNWLDSTQEIPGDSINDNDTNTQNRPFTVREFYKQLASYPSPLNQRPRQSLSKQQVYLWIFIMGVILLRHIWGH